MLPRIYSFLGRWLHFRAKFLIKEGFFAPYCGFCCGNGEIYCGERGDELRRKIGGVAEILRLFLGISRRRPKHKKENHTLSEDLCGFLACYPKIVFPSFELCVFFSELCIRCYPKLSLKFRIIFEEPFRDLHRIEGSSLFDLVAHQPKGETIGVG